MSSAYSDLWLAHDMSDQDRNEPTYGTSRLFWSELGIAIKSVRFPEHSCAPAKGYRSIRIQKSEKPVGTHEKRFVSETLSGGDDR